MFFSYNTEDRDAVGEVARACRDRGLKVFLDQWYLTPGQNWQAALASTLRHCRAVAIFLGPRGMGRWQQREEGLALDRQAAEPAFPVIPVLLPDADHVRGFLSLNTWVDLRSGIGDAQQLDVLVKAIRSEPPGPDVALEVQEQIRQEIQAVLATVNPYRSLRYFREEDAPFFFGRDTFIERLAEAVNKHPLVAVVGASGSGKSSLVRAGLLPCLRQGLGG